MSNTGRLTRICAIAVTAACLWIGIGVADVDGAEKEGSGQVYLVGMGPGDPDLATIRATRVIGNADKVFCLQYLTETLTPMARPGVVEEVSVLLAKRFYGANRRNLPSQLLAQAAGAEKRFAEFAARVRQLVADGKTVAIVDSGDPLIFGAWAWVTEEFDDLPLEVVPGVSSFNAANAALKRDVMWGGRRCVVLSGGDVLGIPPREGRMETPSVFFTHRTPLPKLVPQLLAQYPADTPVAVVCNTGIAGEEEIIRATLGTIRGRVPDGGLPSLNLVYVGDILTINHKANRPSASVAVQRQGRTSERLDVVDTITEATGVVPNPSADGR